MVREDVQKHEMRSPWKLCFTGGMEKIKGKYLKGKIINI